MALRKLKKRNYLGEGYVHRFIHNDTGMEQFIPCTQTEYEAMGKKNGHVNNPTLASHTWTHSAGGTIKVDTPDSTLGEDEYTVVDTEAIVRLKGGEPDEVYMKVPSKDVLNDEIEDSKFSNLTK